MIPLALGGEGGGGGGGTRGCYGADRLAVGLEGMAKLVSRRNKVRRGVGSSEGLTGSV